MGLDQYAYSLPSKDVNRVVDFDIGNAPKYERCQIHYWRKHPNLHGWMARLYFEKGGTDDDFNCSAVTLTLDDLSALERAITDGALPDTKGFFFGETTGEEREDDLEFIRKARIEIANARTIAYYAWW